MSMKKIGMAVMALTLAGSVSACGKPKIVRYITGADDQIKLVYSQDGFWSPTTGVVRCKLNAKGQLEKCTDVPLEFAD